MRRLFLSVLLLLLVVGDYAGPAHRPILNRAAEISATPVALHPSDSSIDRVGRLRFAGGWHLTSPDLAFGGLSALSVRGDRFTAISDAGGIVDFRLDQNGAIADARFGDLAQGPGVGLERRDRDSEALVVDPVNGRRWVAYERWNAIWRYGPDGRVEAHARTPAMRDWPDNGGPEAMARLASGAFLVFSEAGDGPGGSRAAVMFAGDPTLPGTVAIRFGYRPLPGYRVTDAAVLPDDRLVLLHRRVSIPAGISTRLSILDPRAIRPGAIVDSREIAALRRPMTADNFEGVAVTRERDRTILWIVSDDNYSPLQRTLLLKFVLDEDA
jgi:hypothetical protein